MVDMRRATAPKSDQLNAEDLLTGPITVLITRVVEYSTDEQPIGIHYEGDRGKPYKPCKSMSRALVFVWGPEADEYVGKSMTLFRDPSVTWAGEEVGGIRISHMSHIRGPQTFPLTAKRGKKAMWTVEPLAAQQQQRPRRTLPELVDAYVATVAAAADDDALFAITSGDGEAKLRTKIRNEAGDKTAEFLQRMTRAVEERRAALSPAGDDADEGSAEDSFEPADDDLDDAFPAEPSEEN